MRAADFEKQYITTSRHEFEGTDGYITLREPTEDEVLEITQLKDDDSKLTKHILNNLLPACIVDHNFEDDDGKLLSKGAVITILKKSGHKMQKIINEWFSEFSDSKETETESKKK